MGFFEPLVIGGGGREPPPPIITIAIAPIIMKFRTDVKPDVFYTMVIKNCDVATITSS